MFYKNVEFYLESVWLWRIRGSQSQVMMGFILFTKFFHVQFSYRESDEGYEMGKRKISKLMHYL